MHLSDRDLKFAVDTGQLIVDPKPAEYDTTSIDLHLDSVDQARIWDVTAFEKSVRVAQPDGFWVARLASTRSQRGSANAKGVLKRP